jgi:predicted phosphatase
VRDKTKLTEELIALLPEEDRVGLKFAMAAWWFNIRRNGGMRLTSVGYSALADMLDLEHYSYSINDPHVFDKHLILKLDRKMQMPYYIHAVKGIPKKIVFFGSREAVMVNLYGNIEKFLDNYQP